MGKEFEHRGNNNCRHCFHLFVFVDIPCFLPSKVLFLSQSHFHLKDTAKNRNTNWAELTKFPSKKNKEKKKGLPKISIQYSVNRQWEYSNLSGWSCYLDLTPNSHNLLKRNCVAAWKENLNYSLGFKGLKLEIGEEQLPCQVQLHLSQLDPAPHTLHLFHYLD